MTQANKFPDIRKEAFKKARESAGLTTQELALKACLSNRQIEQLENGEIASFYGAQVKYTAAKKVAALLKLSEQDAFDFGSQPPVVEVPVPVEEMALVENKKIKANKPEQIKVENSEAEKPKTEKPKGEKSQAVSPPAPSKPDVALELQDVIVEKGAAKQSASSGSQKKWFLILSLTAAVIFSVVNLRPMFFPEAPKEVVAENPGMPVEPAPANPAPALEEKASTPVAVSTPVITAAVAPSTDCPAMDSAPATYRPEAPKKAADMVYMQSKSAQIVCVIDALGKVQNKQLEPGVGVSVYGKAPLKVLTSGLDQVDLYFQGAKVRPASLSGKTIILEAAELAQPLTPTDSQLR